MSENAQITALVCNSALFIKCNEGDKIKISQTEKAGKKKYKCYRGITQVL